MFVLQQSQLLLRYCVGMIFVATASRYVTPASRYQSRSSMYIQGLIPQNSTEIHVAKAVPIAWHDGRFFETFAHMR